MEDLIAKVLCVLEKPGTTFWIDQLELNIETSRGVMVLKYDGVMMVRDVEKQWGCRSSYLKLEIDGWTIDHWLSLRRQVAMILITNL